MPTYTRTTNRNTKQEIGSNLRAVQEHQAAANGWVRIAIAGAVAVGLIVGLPAGCQIVQTVAAKDPVSEPIGRVEVDNTPREITVIMAWNPETQEYYVANDALVQSEILATGMSLQDTRDVLEQVRSRGEITSDTVEVNESADGKTTPVDANLTLPNGWTLVYEYTPIPENTQGNLPDLNLAVNQQTILNTVILFIKQGAVVSPNGSVDLSNINNGNVGITIGNSTYRVASITQNADYSYTVNFTDTRLGSVTVS